LFDIEFLINTGLAMHTSHNYIPDFELAKISNLFGKTMPELKIN
jgi:hypothetical protein